SDRMSTAGIENSPAFLIALGIQFMQPLVKLPNAGLRQIDSLGKHDTSVLYHTLGEGLRLRETLFDSSGKPRRAQAPKVGRFQYQADSRANDILRPSPRNHPFPPERRAYRQWDRAKPQSHPRFQRQKYKKHPDLVGRLPALV